MSRLRSVLGSRPAGAFLRATDEQRRQTQAPADDQSADSGGAAELVGAHGHGVEAKLAERQPHMADGGGGIAVHRGVLLAAQRHHLGDGLQRPDFVVGELTVHETWSFLSQEVGKLLQVEATRSVDRSLDDLSGAAACLPHARMLDARAEHRRPRPE